MLPDPQTYTGHSDVRILLVVDGMHPRLGGPPAVVAGSAIALRRLGHSVTVLSTATPGEESVARETWTAMLDAGTTLEFCSPARPKDVLRRASQHSALRAFVRSADVVHVHGVWDPISVLAGRACSASGVPYFVSTHGVFDRRAMTRVRSKWLKKRIAFALFDYRSFLDNAAGVVFGSRSEAEQSWIPSAEMKIEYVPNGCEKTLGTVAPSTDQEEWLDNCVGARDGWSRTILCRSRIHPEKGIESLVNAFDAVADEFPTAGLLIAGMRHDSVYEEQLVEHIQQSRAADRICLTTEMVGPESQFLYHCGDIFATASIAEGFSMAIIEALAHGKPTIVTRYCHIPEVEEAGAGVVVESDSQSIAVGLRHMLSQSDEEISAMGSAARALFEDRYAWEQVATLLEYHYGRAAA